VNTIQIITDIVDQSYNEMYAIMRGVADRITDEQVDFAPLVPVTGMSITHGAFLTRLMAKSYLSPVVMFTNVAPHQTHKTDIIAKITGKDMIVMGSNNGCFDWINRDFGFDYLAEVTVKKPFVINGEIIYLPGEDPPADYDNRFDKDAIHKTFGAHVIYGPIAVGLALGVDYEKFGEDRDKDFVVPLDIMEGEIVHIDNYGNLKIYGKLEAKPGSTIKIFAKGGLLAQAEYVTGRMMSSPTGTFVIYPSTSLPHMIDVALIRGNAAMRLGLAIGDVLTYRVA